MSLRGRPRRRFGRDRRDRVPGGARIVDERAAVLAGSGCPYPVRGNGRTLAVHVENDASTAGSACIVGAGSGLRGLRELVERSGGRFTAGADAAGGWLVEAFLR